MKRIIEAIVASSNLAYMVQESEPKDARLHDAADKTLRRLNDALDEVVRMGRDKQNGEL